MDLKYSIHLEKKLKHKNFTKNVILDLLLQPVQLDIIVNESESGVLYYADGGMG